MTLDEAKQHFPPVCTIYYNPADAPGEYVVRVWYGECRETQVYIFTQLAYAREHAWARGTTFPLGREPFDDPCIVESWI